MTERLPSHNFDWFALLEIGFVSADIWISWFGPFAFVKPSLSHLRVLELECWISPETSFVFSMSNHPHFRTGDIHICQSSLYGWLQSASSKSGSHPIKWGKSEDALGSFVETGLWRICDYNLKPQNHHVQRENTTCFPSAGQSKCEAAGLKLGRYTTVAALLQQNQPQSSLLATK